jgi:DNA-binding transcriptional ArsR family regulator
MCIYMIAYLSTFHALADPTRLSILETIKARECAVGEIVERMDIEQSGVSRHLRILTEAGIVQVRPDGQKRLYSLREEAFDEIEAWVAGYRRHWETRLDRFGAALTKSRTRVKKNSQEKPR